MSDETEEIERLRLLLSQANTTIRAQEQRLYEFGRLVDAARAVVRWSAENSIGAGCGPKPVEELKKVLESLSR